MDAKPFLIDGEQCQLRMKGWMAEEKFDFANKVEKEKEEEEEKEDEEEARSI